MSKPKPAPLPSGTVVGGYTIVKKLAAGGFGVVYLAQGDGDHLVAIKEYLPKDAAVRRPDFGVEPRSDEARRAFDWGLQRFSPLPQYAGWPAPVVFVPGNHEYDALDVDQAHEELRKACDRLGIQWLERESLHMQGVRLIGTTLWSDYDALGEHAPEPTPARHSRAGAVQKTRAPDPLTHRLRQREKAFRAANHYLQKMNGRRHGRLFDAEAMRAVALAGVSRRAAGSSRWLCKAACTAARSCLRSTGLVR